MSFLVTEIMGNLPHICIHYLEYNMKQLHINLLVEDIGKSMKFYLQLGLETSPDFTDVDQKCMA